MIHSFALAVVLFQTAKAPNPESQLIGTWTFDANSIVFTVKPEMKNTRDAANGSSEARTLARTFGGARIVFKKDHTLSLIGVNMNPTPGKWSLKGRTVSVQYSTGGRSTQMELATDGKSLTMRREGYAGEMSSKLVRSRG